MIGLNHRILLIVVLIRGVIFSQEIAVKKANESFENLAYQDAIKEYAEIIKTGNGTVEVYQKLGDAYYYNADFENASKWYERMLVKREEQKKDSIKVKEIDPEYYFKAAQSLKHLKKYKKADTLLSKLVESNPNDSRVKKLVENPDYIKNIELQSGRYTIENFSKNSAYSDFAPTFYKDQIVFSSSRKNTKSTRKTNQWTKQPYLNLFNFSLLDTARFSFPREFSKNLSSRLHESTSSFNDKGDIIYFTRNNLIDSRIQKDSVGVIRLKILRAKLEEDSQWSNEEELPFNNNQYSVAHPTLNNDGTKLYFASDMSGGYGMSDIYVVDVYENGGFGTPKNLGNKINTEGRDTFPFISKSGWLYFASDGHLGLGGLDIFVVDLNDPDQKVYNIGEPINSISDDITFIIDEDTKKGFFASNRSGGRGDDDIYSFTENIPLITKCNGQIAGVIVDQISNKAIPEVEIQIRNEKEELVFSGFSDEKGSFLYNADCNNKTYELLVKKMKYDSIAKKVVITKENSKVSDIIKLKSNLPDKGVDLAKLLKLQPMYFKSNSALVLSSTAEELDKIVEYMKKYKTIHIEVGSHTDSKGSDSYNMKLSERRARSTANYIISNGIDPLRIKSKGYGETVLVNRCKNGVKCSKEEHTQNRRSEFIIIQN